MVRVRISQDGKHPERRQHKPESEVVIREDKETPEDPKESPGPKVGAWRGMSERQWFIGLLVVSALLLLVAFRGCVLPSGIGPKEQEKRPAQQEQTTPTPVSTAASGSTYTVQAGDNLGKIAQKTGASIDAIAEENGITRNTILRVGQELKIP
ncbi:MAG TPA: LysM domain-containing protein [Patescibacteria group bacterium]|jgi:LysM repeat protein